MCRGIDHGVDSNGKARRCPSDTSEARRLRWQKAKAAGRYAPLATLPPLYNPPSIVIDNTEVFSVESLKEDIKVLRGLTDDVLIDQKLIRIGQGVEYLAESKYGSPTDHELYLNIEKETNERVALLEALQSNQAAEWAVVEDLRNKLQATGIDRNSHPIISERSAAWKLAYPEMYKAYEEATVLYDKATTTFSDARWNSPKPQSLPFGIMLVKRNEAIKKALNEIGVVFANPDTLLISKDSHKGAVKSLKNALQFYPQAWVDNSNEDVQNGGVWLRIKRSVKKRGAHYNSYKEQKGFYVETSLHMEQKPDNWKPDPHSQSDANYVKTNEKGEWVDPKSGILHQMDTKPGYTNWAYLHYDHYYSYLGNDDTAPTRGRWEKIEVYEEKYNKEIQKTERTGRIVPRYRRLKTTRHRNNWNSMAEITITGDNTKVSKDAGYRVALHEFAHRVEHTTSTVKGYENAFLKRRSGQFTDNPEKLSSIYSGRKSEMGFKDNFPEHYMGKVYSDGSRELLSMGMETLFAGTNGGFVGADNFSADSDYKRFILGMLASSTRNN